MIKVFQIKELIQRMFLHIQTQTENPVLPKRGFTLEIISHLEIKHHKLVLT